MTKCKWCGKEFDKKHNRQMYCNEYCSKESRKEKVKKARLKYYNKYNKKEKIQTYSQYKQELGTGSLSMHRNSNYEIEQVLVKREKQRLKINI